MSKFVAAKSDQLNAEDLLKSGPRTITVTRVTANEGNAEQPVSVYFEGDNGKPWRPCKTTRRVMVRVWGPDASQYVGRSLTLYRDPEVKFGGLQVGGIRISHMSHMDGAITMGLLASQKKMQGVTIKPLRSPARSTTPAAGEEAPGAVPEAETGEAAAPVSGGFDMGEPSIATEAAEIEAKFKACNTLEALAQCKELTLADRKRIVAADSAYRGVFIGIMQREHDRISEGADA